MTGIAGFAMSIAVLVAIVLTAGGVYILAKRPRRERIKGLLMIAVAIVTVGNVWLLTAPV